MPQTGTVIHFPNWCWISTRHADPVLQRYKPASCRKTTHSRSATSSDRLPPSNMFSESQIFAVADQARTLIASSDMTTTELALVAGAIAIVILTMAFGFFYFPRPSRRSGYRGAPSPYYNGAPPDMRLPQIQGQEIQAFANSLQGGGGNTYQRDYVPSRAQQLNRTPYNTRNTLANYQKTE